MFPVTRGKLAGTDIAATEECNGITLLDVTLERLEVRQFRRRPPEPIGAIATLPPHATYSIERRA